MDNPPATPSQAATPRKKNVTTVLDISRANNVAIMLSRIKLDYPGIRRVILEINDDLLSVDQLKAIGKQLPTPDEIERLRSFGTVDKLSKADQYFAQIMDIPRLARRLQCIVYRRKVDLEIEEIRPDLNTLRNASRELRGNQKFKTLLQVVLMIGNSLNGSTFRGNASGFQIQSLLKLKETRTTRGGPQCRTLLHYLARVIMKKDPSIATFIEDLSHLEAAARVSVASTLQSVDSLVSGFLLVKEELQEHRKLAETGLNDRFVPVMQTFIHGATPAIEALKNMRTSVEVEVRSLLAYFGEDPDSPETPKPEDFFGMIATFSSSLQKCALEVHEAELKNAQLKPPVVTIQEAEEDESRRATQKPRPTVKPAPGSFSRGNQDRLSVERGDLDQAIRSMREGKRRPRPARPLSKIFFDGSSGRRQSKAYVNGD